MKTQKRNNDFKKVVITFKEPIVTEKPVAKVVEKPKKVNTTIKGRFRFSSKLRATGQSKIILTRLILNHERIIHKAKDVIANNKDMTAETLRTMMQEFIKGTGMSPVIYPAVDLDIFCMLKDYKANGEFRPRKRSFLSFKESSTSNLRFSISQKRDRIYFEDMDLILTLDKRIPSVIEFEEYFYLNISCVNPTTLSDLKVGIFSA